MMLEMIPQERHRLRGRQRSSERVDEDNILPRRL
jgi:hypothetical protein